MLWWERSVFFFLCVAIGFLGIGRIELPGLRLSSWSVARTVFFFWLTWKVLQWLRYGRVRSEWQKMRAWPALIIFFAFVTLSLLPYFREASDYRYFLFAFFHYVVLVDLFAEPGKSRLLLFLLGVVPGFLVVRGVLFDPSVLNLGYMIRFGYPLDHPNTAGYLFSMAIPLSLAVLANREGWLRWGGGLSLGAQFAGLALSYSRGAWLGCAISLFCLALMERRLRNVMLALGIMGSLAVVFVSPVRSRLVSLADALRDPDMVWRLQIMEAAVSIGMENPFLGVGYGRENLRTALANRQPDFFSQRYVHHSHNVYTELLCGTGFLGLGAFLWLLGSTLARLITYARVEELKNAAIPFTYLAASLIAFMVSGLGDVPFYHHETRIFFFSLLALSWLYLEQARKAVLTPV